MKIDASLKGHQRGFGLLELTITVSIATAVALGLVQREIAQIENEITQQVASEVLAIHDAARVFHGRNDEWPDEVNDCADAIPTLEAGGFLTNYETSAWGPDFTTSCAGGPPRLTFTVTAEAPAERFARSAASRLIGSEVDAANATVSSTVPIPGAGPVADVFLHRRAVPGRPELNQMQTAIDMNNNDINNISQLDADLADLVEADIEDTLRWGDSQLNNNGGRGVIELGIGAGGGGGQIDFYRNGVLSSSLLADAIGSLSTDGNFTAQGTLVGGEIISLGGLTVNDAADFLSNVDVQGGLTVAGQTLLQGLVTIDNDLDVVGTATIQNDLGVGGDASVGGSLDVAGPASFQQPVSMASDLDVDGLALFTGPVEMTDSLSLTGDAEINGRLDVTGRVVSESIMEARDFRTEEGVALSTAVSEAGLVGDGDIIPKQDCPGTLQPRLYLAISQISSGPTDPLEQFGVGQNDLGNSWEVVIALTTDSGVTRRVRDVAEYEGDAIAMIRCVP